MKRVTFLMDYTHDKQKYLTDDSVSLDDDLADALFNSGVVSINGEQKPVPDKPLALKVNNTHSTTQAESNVVS